MVVRWTSAPNRTTPTPIAVGDRLQLRSGSAVAGGTVVALACTNERVRGALVADLCTGRYRVRHLDGGGMAWGAGCQGRPPGDPAVISLSCPQTWEPVPARRAARLRVDRTAIVIENVEPGGKRRELVALDVSALGFSAIAIGTPAPIGSTVRTTCDLGSCLERRWLHAVVVCSRPGSLGRYAVGLRFDPASGSERQRIMRWRDGAATGTAPRGATFG